MPQLALSREPILATWTLRSRMMLVLGSGTLPCVFSCGVREPLQNATMARHTLITRRKTAACVGQICYLYHCNGPVVVLRPSRTRPFMQAMLPKIMSLPALTFVLPLCDHSALRLLHAGVSERLI